MTKTRRNLVAVILLAAAFIILLNQTLMVTALPVMATTFHVSLSLAQWLTSGYVLAIGLITPVSANITAKYNSRTVFLTSLLVFIAGTVLGLLTNIFLVVLVSRLVQALAGGVIITYVMVSMLSIYPPETRGVVLGFVSLVLGAGPALGPVISGLIMANHSWRMLYIMILIIMVVIWLLALMLVPNFSPRQKNITLDAKSAVSAAVGIGLILSSVTCFQSQAGLASGMMVVGIIVTVYFVKRQKKLAIPLLDMRLFRHASFRLMLVTNALVFAVLMGTEALLPVFMETELHQSGLTAGLIMLPGAIMNALVSPIVGRIYDKVGPKQPLLVGMVILLGSCVPFAMVTAKSSLLFLAIIYLIRLTGVAVVMAVSLSESMAALQPTELGYGTAFNNTFRQIAGSGVGTILFIIMAVPANLISGFKVAMLVTAGIAILASGMSLVYIYRYYQAK